MSTSTSELIRSLIEPSPELTWDLLDLTTPKPTTSAIDQLSSFLINPPPINRTRFRFKRTGIQGNITRYTEEICDKPESETQSLSMGRTHQGKSQVLSGTKVMPFQPGGLIKSVNRDHDDDEARLHRNNVGLFDIPSGFTRGLAVDTGDGGLDLDQVEEEIDQESTTITTVALDNDSSTSEETADKHDIPFDTAEIEGLVPFNYTNFTASSAGNSAKAVPQHTWAHVVDLDHKISDSDLSTFVPHMARQFPFELDTFQKEAVFHLEQGDSVFVAAHTSAGKTVVAEYAIAMAARNMTKTIYTSPIKALSNQKFRDFKQTFPDVDVGLITGDVQINPEATCLIMTTEILRSMVYRGADLIRDVEFVIFDEVHYVNDIDRGVVWEEVIIMLPDHVKYILLSATVPNTFEFANWVGRTKQKDIYVISTPKRPVPLEIFISAKGKLCKVVDGENRRFHEDEFKKHKDILEPKPEAPQAEGKGGRGGRGGARGGAAAGRGGNRGGARGGASSRGSNRGGGGAGRGGFNKGRAQFNQDGPSKNTWLDLVHQLKPQNLLPVVIFVFSKKKCEMYADSLQSVDFCNGREKSEIHMFIERSLGRLKKEDRNLPQIIKIREMLSRGIAVHHGGLLPIVKEFIEILFSKGLVKVLFATETFAMGLNLPTRTVVFSSMRKHDGRGFRNLLAGEFTQMSGRAGRRGLDKTGTVIIMAYNNPISPTDFKEIVLGTPTKLSSQFRLTYNMILNLLRIEALRVEEMIKYSFSENSTQVLLPENQKRYDELVEDLKNITITPCKKCHLQDVEKFCALFTEYEELYGQCISDIHDSPVLKTQILRIGRLVCFRDNTTLSTRVGFIVKSVTADKSMLLLTFDHGKEYEEAAEKYKLPYIPIPTYITANFPKIVFSQGFRLVSVPYEQISFVGKYGLRTSMSDIIANVPSAILEASVAIKMICKYQNRFEEQDFKQVAQLSLHGLTAEKNNVLSQIEEMKTISNCSNFNLHYSQYHHQFKVTQQIEQLQRLISDENLDLLPDYEQRLEVLETLGFIDSNHTVVLKGRVACEINCGWELIITELVLDNFLGDFDPAEIVALLSCFVYEGRTNEEEPPLITPRLEHGKSKILDIAKKLMQVYTEKQVSCTAEEVDFTESKRFALVNVVYEWASGLSFNEIMQQSVEAEGTIVRVITRLDEICREVRNAALIVGDSGLYLKMGEAQEKIKRDIVFCASLYL
ncbi:Antiviral helicase SKI2 [Spathaspora sp. JA1]|nr:Antiviral helicase SKI2 [Spathaspora sp. JA1]